MLKIFYLPTTIFSIFSAITVQSQVVLANLPAREIAKVAEKITVNILTPASPGSGIIIERKDNTYKVLTARHVIDSIKKGEESDIKTFDGELHPVNTENIKTFGENWDLAVVEFTTAKSYEVGELGDSSILERGEIVYVGGFPISKTAINIPILTFTEGKLTAIASQPLDQGYGLVYDNNTLPGMSGGVVLDENAKIVGVHGRADEANIKETENPNIRIKSGFNLAIPINFYLGLTQQIDFDVPDINLNQASTADDYYVKATYKSQQQDYEGAIPLLNQALSLNPDYVYAYNNRGLAYYFLKQYQKAIADYNQAITINPMYSAAFNNRGTLYYSMQKPGQGKADHDLAILLSTSVASNSPRLMPNIVVNGFRRNSFTSNYTNPLGAYPHLQRHLQIIGNNDGIPLDQSEAYAYYNRGIAYLNIQRYPQAKEHLQQAANLYQQQGSTQISEKIINLLNQIPN